MIGNICLLLEQIAILFCLHCLYGEKFKFDIKTTSYLTLYMIIMVLINYYHLPSAFSLITYVIIALYCGLKFRFKLKELIINNILYMVIVGGIQLIIAIIYSWIFNMLSVSSFEFKNNELLIINVVVLIVICVFIPKFEVHKLSIYLQDKEKILVIFLLFFLIITIASYANYKVFEGFNFYQYLILFISVVLFSLLAGQVGKYKIKSKEIETELKMHKLFSDSFSNLIDDIRLRQHEFDNHISTIYSLHYTCTSYEELVKAQNEYSQVVIKENRYNKLLKAGNPLLIGFLYGKFIEIEKFGIAITYQINIGNFDIDVPIFRIVEILGNLMKNATEAMRKIEMRKELYVAVIEVEGAFSIEVRNKSQFIEYSEIENFFKKGFSKKGNNRGLGLYNVKSICDEYSLNILCENKILNNENWLCFCITNKKETI